MDRRLRGAGEKNTCPTVIPTVTDDIDDMASNTASPPEDGGEGQSLDRATVEAQAFLGWVRAVGVETDNLTDGTALMQVLEGV